jgi:sulfur carrier protein ThiS adenylyltransferase
MEVTQEILRAKMQQATVGLAGLGGLGSNVAAALARAGIGRLILVDFDAVEAGNLNRQHYFTGDVGTLKTDALARIIARINPAVTVELHNVMLTEENIPAIFAGADIIAECFDRADMKAVLTRVFFNQLAPRGKKLVAVSGLAGCGPANAITTRLVSPIFALVGDGYTDVSDVPVLVASRVIIAAMHQAHQIIQWILATD